MDLFDLFGSVFDSATDLLLCKGDIGEWLRHRVANFLLALANIAFSLLLYFSIRSVWVIGIILGAIGMLYFLIIDVRYSFWWIREGRYGFDPPWLELFTFRSV